jgi:AsmA protein
MTKATAKTEDPRMKTVLKIVGILIAVVIVVLIALPFIIDVNVFRPQIEAELTDALGRQVTVGNLSLSLIGGSVSADNLSIADDPAFSRQPFVKAKALAVGVELMPLILSKKLNVTNLTIDQPQVALISRPPGKWNFSSIGGSRPAAHSSGASANPDLSVGKLSIKNGTVSVAKEGSPAKPQVFQNVDITVKDFSFTAQFPFTLAASLPGGGNVKLDGKAGPISATDAAQTPLEASISVKQMDLAASGFVEPSTGIGGSANFDGRISSNGHELHSSGTATADKLKLSPKGSPAPKAVNIKYATVFEMQKQTGQLTQGDVILGQAVAHLTGSYQVEPTTAVVNMKLNADNMPVNDLESMLPAMGIVLPKGSSLQGGTLSADLAISGPADKLVITGPVKMANTKLVGFDFTSKLSEISKFTGGGGGSSPDTSIQNFSADVRAAQEGITTQNVNLTVPSIGVLTGSGTISPQEALNYTMNAKLGGSVGALAEGGLPFFIQGTTSDPKFVPNVKGMLTNQFGALKGLGQGQQNPANSVMQGLGGLLGKKKQ